MFNANLRKIQRLNVGNLAFNAQNKNIKSFFSPNHQSRIISFKKITKVQLNGVETLQLGTQASPNDIASQAQCEIVEKLNDRERRHAGKESQDAAHVREEIDDFEGLVAKQRKVLAVLVAERQHRACFRAIFMQDAELLDLVVVGDGVARRVALACAMRFEKLVEIVEICVFIESFVATVKAPHIAQPHRRVSGQVEKCAVACVED